MSKLAFAALSFALCGSLACNQIADINDPIPIGSGTTTPGSDSGTASTGGDKGKLIGTWKGPVTTTAECSDGPRSPNTVDETAVFTEVPNGARLVDASGCSVDFTLSGNKATGSGGSECSTKTSSGQTVSIKMSGGELTLTSDTTLHLTLTSTASAGDVTCDITQEGQFTKAAGS